MCATSGGTGGGPPVKKDSRGILASLGNLHIPRPGGSASSANGSTNGYGMGKKKKIYQCLVCMEAVQIPHAARCGHVCCKVS